MPAVLTQDPAFLFRAIGDAMSPLIRNGDTVMLEPGNTGGHGDVVALSMDGRVLLRRKFHSGAFVSLLPENPDYDAIAWEPGAPFEVLGTVTHVIHALKS